MQKDACGKRWQAADLEEGQLVTDTVKKHVTQDAVWDGGAEDRVG